MPDICLDLQDVITSVALPPRFTSSKSSTLLWIIGMVVSCCDATSIVLITSFWSHRQAHPCVLWRSKLRNTFCTLDFAKYCFRILSWNARLNVSIFYEGAVLPVGNPVCPAVNLHTQRFSEVDYKLLLCTFLEWSDTRSRDSLPPSHYPVLDEAFRTRLPGLWYCCILHVNISMGVFSPSYWRKRVEGKGG